MADMDGDGRIDMLSGTRSGVLLLFQRTQAGFSQPTVLRDKEGEIIRSFGANTYIAPADVNDDGDLDLYVSGRGISSNSNSGGVVFVENVGIRTSPSFEKPVAIRVEGRPFQTEETLNVPIAIVDWDIGQA